MFTGPINSDVTFADVNLGDKSKNLRSVNRRFASFDLGEGGWPSVRFFNGNTGMDGEAYIKQTDELMCNELGLNYTYLFDFIEEAADTALCCVDGRNCDTRSLRYLNERQQLSPEEWHMELARLQKLLDAGNNHDPWIWKQTKILLVLIEKEESASEL